MDAPTLQFALRIAVILGPPIEVGETPRGLHRIVPIVGGTVEGPLFQGVVLPGGADWQYIASNGLTDVDARYTLETASGVRIGVSSKGVRFGPADALARLARGEAVPADQYYFRTAIRLEAPAGEFEGLGRSIFVAKAERLPSEVRIDVYQVL